MRRFLVTITAVFLLVRVQSQGLGVNDNNANPHPSAMLDVSSNNKGVLIPRMTSGLRLAISSPATGLLVFDTDLGSLFVYVNGWKPIKSLSSLSELIQGVNPGDILKWSGTQWVVAPLSSLIQYYYRDKDGDGFGDKFQPIAGTSPLEGFVADNTDCDDNNPDVHPGAVDAVGNGIDEDCDGVDGNTANTIFVSTTTGNNTNNGSKASPVKTIAAGISKAVAGNKTQVFIAQGTYPEAVNLANGISLYGGFSPANWAPTGSGTVVIGTVLQVTIPGTSVLYTAGITGQNITLRTTVNGINVNTANSVAFGGSSNYGFYCNTCPGVTLSNSTIIAGNGENGRAGFDAPSFSNAANRGSDGLSGNCDNGTLSIFGGPGAIGSCAGASGGHGGRAGTSLFDGENGEPSLGNPVGFGFGGLGGKSGHSDFGSTPVGDGGPGGTGVVGSDGINGMGGSGGGITNNFWRGLDGTDGFDGASGGSGGGGGGGGGDGGAFVIDKTGSSGGGGGAGGCGGDAGTGGQAGGGSFALFLVNSTNFILTNCTLQSGSGGSGGNGGVGAAGQQGGIGGTGGPRMCDGRAGAGGNGGYGGNGGHGGAGGGGIGGYSYGVYKVNTTLSTAGSTLSAGPGGAGGTGGGHGFTGSSGLHN